MPTFRELHRTGCFVLPNPWDAGSARLLAACGFSALGTTSAGLAFALGRPDSPTSLDRATVLANARDIVRATDLPVTADYQAGYGDTTEGVFESVRLCIETGVAGLSIEDATGDPDHPLFDLDVAVKRVRAARAAIDGSGADVVLTARAECALVGRADPLRESIRRLTAYAEAGADCLYAPGFRDATSIEAIVRAVSPLPVNALASPGFSVAELADLGVRRVSIGSAFARIGLAAFLQAAKGVAEGDLSSLKGAEPFANLNALFETPSAR
ncbi:MAG: isocitrate lyase/phosphoenolpyruvate mutase family protein [Myxococcota bacterium]